MSDPATPDTPPAPSSDPDVPTADNAQPLAPGSADGKPPEPEAAQTESRTRAVAQPPAEPRLRRTRAETGAAATGLASDIPPTAARRSVAPSAGGRSAGASPGKSPSARDSTTEMAAGSSSVRRSGIKRRWIFRVALAAVVGAVFGTVFASWIEIPDVQTLGQVSPALVTQLFDDQGRRFHSYHGVERRFMLEEGEVPEVVEHALIAMEDSRFYDHTGVDPWGVLRASLTGYGGASTLTMQLAGSVFLDRTQRTFERKVREAFMAVEIEKFFSKQQIITHYCNLMNFSGGNYGIEAASRDYFRKPSSELEIHEAAALIAVLPRPSDWNPRRRRELVEKRRNLVIDRMLDEDFITQEEHDRAVATPLIVADPETGKELGSYFAEEIRRDLYGRYGEKGLYERGLHVNTTLNPDAQRAAETAVRNGLMRIDQIRGWRGAPSKLDVADVESQELPSWTGLDLVPGAWAKGIVLEVSERSARIKIAEREFVLAPDGYEWTRKRRADELLSRGDVAWFRLGTTDNEGTEDAETEVTALPPLFLAQEPELEASALLVESATGAVKAMVGGWDFGRNEFNRATQAKRQAGSSFKPFVYGAALEFGFTPADTLFDAPVVFDASVGQPAYSPRNFSRQYYGIITLRKALEKSVNVTAVKLQDLVGADRVVDFAHRAGIESDLPAYPTLALGVIELTAIELAGAYGTLANQGFYVEPYFIDSVTTREGRVLERHQPNASRAMTPEVAYVLTHMLEGVIDRGTGSRLRDLDVDIAGKTGTTDGYTDAWFTGYTPTHTLIVWVGFDQKRRIGRNMTGAEAALPIWREIMVRGLEEGWVPREARFQSPADVVIREIEPESGLLATPLAPKTIIEAFLPGTEPVKSYDPSWARIQALPWYQQSSFYGVPKSGEKMPDDISEAAWASVVQGRRDADD